MNDETLVLVGCKSLIRVTLYCTELGGYFAEVLTDVFGKSYLYMSNHKNLSDVNEDYPECIQPIRLTSRETNCEHLAESLQEWANTKDKLIPSSDVFMMFDYAWTESTISDFEINYQEPCNNRFMLVETSFGHKMERV